MEAAGRELPPRLPRVVSGGSQKRHEVTKFLMTSAKLGVLADIDEKKYHATTWTGNK